MSHSSPTSAHSPSLAQPATSNPSTTPVSSSHSHSTSSQHDPASPPHFTASSTDATLGAYPSQPSATGRPSNVLDAIETAMNGNHPLSQPFRTTNPAFHSPFSSSFSPPSASSSYNMALQSSRQQGQPFRSDHLSVSSSAFSPHSHFPSSPPSYPTKADVFGTGQPMDALGRFDYDAFASHEALHGQQQPPHVLKGSQVFNPASGFSLGGAAGSSALQPQVPKLTGASSQGGYNSASVNGALPYLNGVTQSQQGPPMQGPPPTMNGILPPFTAPPHSHGHGQHPMLHTPGPGPGVQASSQGQSQQPSQQQVQQQQAGRIDQSQEEISTIFVVGFPDDMQEREFQNMFTFSVGFEAATLKIPNKDSSAYGPASGVNRQGYPHGLGGSAGSYSGSQDPYNLVTVNSGGVVVDGPLGTSSSWQQGSDYATAAAGDGTHGQPPTMPPRKQIIGFAKFRTRQEALEARDLLQGRRVDIDKGAVLKAEMAKKNLHTKRGVGPLGLPIGLMGVAGANANPVASEMLVPGLNGYPAVVSAAPSGVESANAPMQGPDSLSVRDRQMGALGAMGLVAAARRQEEDKDRRPFREEEEQRRKKEKEQQERNHKLRMSNAQVYDAFHSVPADHQARRGSSVVNGNTAATSGTGPLSPSAGFGDSGTAFPGFGFNTNGGPSSNTFQLTSHGSVMVGHGFQSHPFSNSSEVLSNGAHWGLPGKLAGPLGGEMQKLPARPPSAQSSPPSNFDAPYIPPSGNTTRGVYYGGGGGSSDSSAFSPPDFSTPLPPIGPRPRAQSPSNNGEMQTFGGFQGGSSSLPRSNASSVTGGSQGSSLDEQFSRTLMVSTHQGMTSPQLPSPGSGGSSSNTRQGNASDQNPPINTLYVGNLSNSPMPPGFAPNYLEDALKNLFSQCKGYRKLCFRQKSNGPMCFVEFEDVQHATKALNELYGNQLNGLVKGGIRLSFSKNPLGVRPSPAGSVANPPISRRDGREGWNGPIQPPGPPSMNYSSIHDAFQTRPLQPQQGQQQPPGLALDIGVGRPGRLADLNEMSSPPAGTANAGFSSYNASFPPSRFFSPPPSQVAFGAAATVGSPNGHPSSRFGPNSPFVSEDERLRFRDVPTHSFASSPGLENTTRVG